MQQNGPWEEGFVLPQNPSVSWEWPQRRQRNHPGLGLGKIYEAYIKHTCATGTPVVTNSHARGAVSLNISPQLEQEYTCVKLKCTESKNAFITLPRVPKSQNVYESERDNLLMGAEVPAA